MLVLRRPSLDCEVPMKRRKKPKKSGLSQKAREILDRVAAIRGKQR